MRQDDRSGEHAPGRRFIRAAFAVEGPAIIDAVVVSDELPNLPHLDLELVGHVAMAKAKEALLAITGN